MVLIYSPLKFDVQPAGIDSQNIFYDIVFSLTVRSCVQALPCVSCLIKVHLTFPIHTVIGSNVRGHMGPVYSLDVISQ